jgi:diguanylate cyclase (GGDEF)-like protein
VRSARRRGGLTGWIATISLLCSAFAVLALSAPPRHAEVTASIVVAATVSTAGAAYAMVRASRMPAFPGALLAMACLAVAAAAAAASADPPGGGVEGLRLERGSWLLVIAGLVLPGIAIRRLIGELRGRVTHIARLSRTDPLTGIANHLAWDEELPREAARSRRDGAPLCVAVLDLDRMGAFNELRGHAAGDRLLQAVAAAWAGTVRTSDLIARLDGGRFGLLLRRCPLEHALVIVERLRVCVPETQSASAGIASWDGREQLTAVMERATAALQAAKLGGRDRVKVATRPSIDVDRPLDDWTAVVHQLLERRSVVSAYQPIIDLSTQRVVAFEALARPDAGLVDISVERMFSTAQRMGLARELDWLCRRAALADTSWLPQGALLFLNCNVGLLVDPVHRVDQMLLVLESAGLQPQEVVIEITERELAGDLQRLRSVVDTYRREGFRFAVDDVGEGHSTLEVLAAVRPEFIKVARSLVIEAGNIGARAAIRAMVAFARECGASVIAEGIEQPQTAADMRNLGVDLAQGYLFGRPALPARAA